MDPIEIALKLKLDEKSLTEAKEQVRQDLRGENVSGMSSGQIAKHVESKRAGGGGLSPDMEKLLSGMSPQRQQKFLADNPHIAAMVAAAKAGPPIRPPGIARPGYDPMGENSSRALLAAQAMDMENARRAARESLKLQKDAAMAEAKAQKAASLVAKDKAAFMRDMSFLMMPMMNPGSLWGTLFATRQTFGAMANTKMGQGMIGKFGLSGIGGAAMATGVVVGAATALGVALKALAEAVKGTLSAYENARKEYARALMSGGLPLGFTVRRAALANVLGVGENEVLQFGRQVLYLNDKLKWSNKIISETTPELTGVSWEFSILGQNMKGLFATLASDAAPALEKFANALSTIVQAVTGFIDKYPIVFKAMMAAMLGPGGIGMLHTKAFDRLDGESTTPPPSAYMKQLKVSSWERMGLVVGGYGTAGNPAQQTAKNTERTVHELKGIRKALIPRSGAEFFNPAFSNP